VTFDLAQEGHGTARVEYVLRPLDATRSTLTVRFSMTVPPGMTKAQALTTLRGKAEQDLRDFAAFRSSGPGEEHPSVTPPPASPRRSRRE
jgi:hypothetical protein